MPGLEPCWFFAGRPAQGRRPWHRGPRWRPLAQLRPLVLRRGHGDRQGWRSWPAWARIQARGCRERDRRHGSRRCSWLSCRSKGAAITIARMRLAFPWPAQRPLPNDENNGPYHLSRQGGICLSIRPGEPSLAPISRIAAHCVECFCCLWSSMDLFFWISNAASMAWLSSNNGPRASRSPKNSQPIEASSRHS